MAFVHGKNTVVTLDDNDLSAFCNKSEMTRSADSHDVTTYGPGKSHVYDGGLLDGDASISGVYDNTATTGPRAVIMPLIGTVVEFVRQPEGVGAGKPTDTVNVLVEKYVETSPVADMVTWSCDLKMSGDVVSTTQGA